MSDKPRSSLDLGVDDNEIDIEELATGLPRPAPSAKETKAIMKAGEKQGFVSRQPKKRRRVSPYSAQLGGRCRPRIKELLQEAATRDGIYDTQALERAIGSYLSRQGFEDLLVRFKDITKHSKTGN